MKFSDLISNVGGSSKQAVKLSENVKRSQSFKPEPKLSKAESKAIAKRLSKIGKVEQRPKKNKEASVD